MAHLPKHPLQGQQHAAVVVDTEYPQRPLAAGLGCDRGFRHGGFHSREPEPHRRPQSHAAIDRQPPLLALCDAENHAQAESSSLQSLGGEVRLEALLTRVDDEADVHGSAAALGPCDLAGDVGHAHEPDRRYRAVSGPVPHEQ